MLTVKCPPTYKPERKYICRVLLQEFLGIEYCIVWEKRKDWSVTVNNDNELLLPDIFFQTPEKLWLAPESLPKQSLLFLDASRLSLECPLVDKNVPVIFGDPDFPEQTSSNSNNQQRTSTIPIDIFGSAFFMLSRYEELVKTGRDEHDRFPASSSLALQESFLERPIIDEYMEIFRAAIKKLWPGLKTKKREGRIRITCDIDTPFDPIIGYSLLYHCKISVGDLLKRRDIPLLIQRWRNRFAHRRGDYQYDMYHTFDWYMDICEKYSRRAAFYFICGHSGGTMDGSYQINEPAIQNLLKKIADRSHEIGMHGSYNSFRSASTLKKERQALISACRWTAANEAAGNRQHYLRWDAGQTPDHLDAAGFSYDTTGSFADRPGFRYGTSKPFPMWSWQQRKTLSLYQKPLVVMECSVIAPRYLGLGYSRQAKELMLKLRERAMMFGGDFTLLWHNSHLTTENDREFFGELIKL